MSLDIIIWYFIILILLLQALVAYLLRSNAALIKQNARLISYLEEEKP